MDYANLEKIPASLKNIEDASNLLNEKITKINNEKADANIVASSLNDLDEKIKEQEKVTSSSLNNLNEKIELINANIENLICTLTINILIDGSAYTYKNVNIEITYQGNTITNWGVNDYTNLATDSNGQIIINIPYGSQYKIMFTGTTDYIEPDTINGVADDINKNYIVQYTSISKQELVKPFCNITGANPSINPNNKYLYIDYLDSNDDVLIENKFTIKFDSVGLPATIVEKVNETNKSVSSILIDRGQKYKTRLQLWDTSLTEEEQAYVKSQDTIYIANKDKRSIKTNYTYKLSGVFLVLKDENNSTFGYTGYKCIDVKEEVENETTYDVSTVIIGSTKYDIRYVSGVGVQRRLESSGLFENWISDQDIQDGKIIGIGVRTQSLIDSPCFATEALNNGYDNACVLFGYNIQTSSSNFPLWNKNILNTKNYTDGRYCMELESQIEGYDPNYGACGYLQNYSLQTGNHTQTPFIMSMQQFSHTTANNTLIKGLGKSINFNIDLKDSVRRWSSSSGNDARVYQIRNGGGADGYYGAEYPTYNSNKVLPVYNFY